MTHAPPWLWLAQFGLLVFAGLACLFFPGALLGSSYAADGLRIAGSAVLGLAGFSIFALMTRRTRLRRGFGVAFAVTFGFAAVLQWIALAADHTGSGVVALGIVLTLLAAANLWPAFEPVPEWRPQNDAGVAGSKPPQVWVAWLFQGLVLLGGAGLLVFGTEYVLSRISLDSRPASPVALDTMRLTGAFVGGIALLSFHAARAQRSFAWRGFAFFFAVAFAISIATLLWVFFAGSYSAAGLALLVPPLVFLPMNAWIRRMRGVWDPKDLGQVPDAWTILDLIAGPLMALSVLRKKRRSSHLVGAGARGTFTVVDEKARKFPAHDFFEPGRAFPVQVRFANLTELDDAALDVRGFSVKFSDQRYESPLDLMMNTGAFCPAFNIPTFAGFVASKFVPASGSEAIVRRNLVAREGGVAGLRRAPDSYASLHYYGQIVRYWIEAPDSDTANGENGQIVRHLVRYRCVPKDPDQEESGLPSDEDAAHIWLRKRLPQDTRPSDYLRQEIKKRVGNGGVSLRLQAQFHRWEPNDSLEWFNASVEWDEEEHPWCDLGRLKLTEAIDDADTEYLQFYPGNHPMTLGIPRATGAFDYRSMGDSEARIVRSLQNLRVWMYGTFGLPRFGAIERP